ncbi:hypothetical protein M405DRAFT_853780 [Rhizopogon salebrosus TDB-379]|nr:hypothetical protein M405DRAFT_853780 [Rhizopogon salebrosus TDB-379]
MPTKSRATRHTINSLRAGHKTAHKIMTTGTRKAFKPKTFGLQRKLSPHAIFLGLGPGFSEAQVAEGIPVQQWIETATIIRDGSTGISKGFDFAQFPSIEHARAFVDPLFPFVQVPPPASHGATQTAACYKALETGVPHNGRRVKIDYSQSALPDKARGPQNMNDGTRDIGNTQGPVLLFRGLDPLSRAQAIAQAMMNSAGPGQSGAEGMRGIILIKDRVTLASFGLHLLSLLTLRKCEEECFIQSAASVLAATMSPQIHPSGFRISDKPVTASFAHQYSFQQVDHMLRDETAIPSSINLGGVEGAFVKYWDDSAMVAVLEFKVEAPPQPQVQASTGPTKEKEKKKGDDASNQPPAPSALPILDKPVTLSFNKGGPGNKPITSLSGPKAPAQISLDDDAEAATSAEDNKATASKMVAPLIASKKTVSNIQKWNQVQEELNPNACVPVNPPPVVTPVVTVSRVPSRAPSPQPVEAELEFSDTDALTCLLCARAFKSLDQLKRHNKESDLHKKNFKDANLREIARQKAVAARQAADSKVPEQPKCDRASERRIMHNQPDVTLPENAGSVVGKKRRLAEGPPPPPSPPPAVNPGQDDANVGNKLLKMMGWKTNIYAQGAGLGASKGRELGKYADDYTGSYVHMAQDAVRERFGS